MEGKFLLSSNLIIGFVTSEMFEDLTISDIESKETSSFSSDSGNYEECCKAPLAKNNPLELSNTFYFSN